MINYLAFLVFPTFLHTLSLFLPDIIVVRQNVPKTFFFMPEFNKSLSLWKPSFFTYYFNNIRLIYRGILFFNLTQFLFSYHVFPSMPNTIHSFSFSISWNQLSICWKCQTFGYYITQLNEFKKSNSIKWIV